MATRLRWFQFSMRTFLILPPIIFAALWWWQTMPERTANRFIFLMKEGRFDEANALLEPPAKFAKCGTYNYAFNGEGGWNCTIGEPPDWQVQFADCPVEPNLRNGTCRFQVYAVLFTARHFTVDADFVSPSLISKEVMDRHVAVQHAAKVKGLVK